MERIAQARVDSRRPIRGPKRLLVLRSDARLVELVRTGDEAAFEVLYERHVAGLLGFCRHMLGSQHEAEDAVQQAFASAHGSMRRGSREIAFKSWLYTIARNRCLSILRARRERPAELPEISTAGLDERVERSAELRELVADVQRLPEQQRAALVLSELGDLSHAEVAEVIGSDPSAIKGLVFRARAALAERRDARDADCSDIRLELAAATGGGLRRGRLRYHLETCPGCVAYLDEMRRQRKLLGIALPVVPTLALRDSVMSAAGIGAGAAGAGAVGGATGLGAATAGSASAAGGAAAGGAATVGGTLLGGTAVKLIVAGAIVAGGAGIATEVAVRGDGDAPPSKTPSSAGDERSGAGTQEGSSAVGQGERSAPGLEGRRGARGAERRAVGQRRAERRRGGRSAAGSPRGKAVGQERGKAIGRDGAGTVRGGQRKAAGDVNRQAAPGGPGTSQGGGQEAGGAKGGAGGGQGAGGAPAVPRQEAGPGEAAPKATPPPAADGGGAANRPAFQHPRDQVPEQNR
ncbi:MAG TPA: sigma-70 family RNA polymerase sigma factor [Thermoleophilaceae bacterium]|nr:sigma-70 family RNA polymerase sigma factor [Thermoleophilaceae bacterium]